MYNNIRIDLDRPNELFIIACCCSSKDMNSVLGNFQKDDKIQHISVYENLYLDSNTVSWEAAHDPSQILEEGDKL